MADFSVWVEFSSFDVHGLSLRESVDVASFSCPLSFGHWNNLEKAAFKLSRVGADDSSISFVFFLNMKGSVSPWMNKGVSLIVLVDIEDLIGSTGIIVEDKFVFVAIECEALLVVGSVDDFVGEVGIWCEEEVLWSLHKKSIK